VRYFFRAPHSGQVFSRSAALIFHGIVQKRGDGLVLIATGFKDKCCDTHQVRDVWDIGSLSELRIVKPGGKMHGKIEAVREEWLPGCHFFVFERFPFF
jgi:hypothetical protein